MNMAVGKRPVNDKGVRPKAGPFLLFFGWLAAASVILFAELDRQARYQPDLTGYVPTAFRSFSQATRVERLLKDRADPSAAYLEASRLLLRRPLPAENLSLYALAAARTGKEQQSIQALELAAARGWHDEIAQYAALDAAARAGDWPSASLRLQALLQIQARAPVLGRAVQDFMADPSGRTALAGLTARSPSFQYQILSLAGAHGSEDTFPLFLDALKPFKGRMDCGAVKNLVTRWLARGEVRLAPETWRLCALDGDRGASTLAFSNHEGDRDPFAWHFSDHPGIAWSLDASGGLTYRHKEQLARLLGWRVLTLAPGFHRVKMEGRPAAMNGNYPSVRLRCVPSGTMAAMEMASNDPQIIAFLVPKDCPVQKLEVKVLGGGFQGFRLVTAQE
ncbi:hypothetical protein [Sphingobium sp. Sx8-8]|uniref:hypothetical protein n=1 Tax=Sphingobium sp. Sx8-8 TaxID=2933617 RepID=UPI001F5A8D0E|nr:hypothetical protein [Sphingobium sp. Sx8-8]